MSDGIPPLQDANRVTTSAAFRLPDFKGAGIGRPRRRSRHEGAAACSLYRLVLQFCMQNVIVLGGVHPYSHLGAPNVRRRDDGTAANPGGFLGFWLETSMSPCLCQEQAQCFDALLLRDRDSILANFCLAIVFTFVSNSAASIAKIA